MELPFELANVIALAVAGAVTYLVVEGFKGLSSAFGLDLSAVAKSIAAVLSAAAVSAVLGVLEIALSLVPAAWVPVVQIGLSLLVALLAMGVHAYVKRSRAESKLAVG